MDQKERLEDCTGHTVFRVESDRLVVERAPAEEGPVLDISGGDPLRGKILAKGDVIAGMPADTKHPFALPYWIDIGGW